MSDRPIRVTVNGQERQLAPDTTVAQLLEQLGLDPRTLAVERNLDLVPRDRHAETHLQENDRLEVVTLVGGG